MTSAQLDMFAEASPRAAPAPCTWTAEERRSIDLALVGVYQELAVAAGLHSLGWRGHLAHASACECIAADPRGAVVSDLSGLLARAENYACDHERHAAWLETEAGREAYGPDAGAGAPRFRDLAREQRVRAAAFRQLIAKVERVPLGGLPIDLAELRARARRARANAEFDLSDPELAVVTHWPAGMMSNGPMCEQAECLACRRFR